MTDSPKILIVKLRQRLRHNGMADFRPIVLSRYCFIMPLEGTLTSVDSLYD